ncbi:PEST proteolytic signal-containing nuclear protein-like [Dermacentor andersoni]|uniref:PEST proteolytic signal-containing nuclear protein-like n=1 Tax=Dermacentor andersoni TaxID=34620 RepID=UPI002155DE15|nr:PEST proteolytic signal-containing nuclear protein-like [Dermacentor andersoni]
MASSTGRSRWDDKGSASLGGGTTAVASGRQSDDEERESASPVDSEKRKLGDEEGGDDAAKKPKITMGFSRTFSSAKATEEKKPGPAPISIKFGGPKSKEQKAPMKKSSSLSVAEAFNQSSDEEEEMPPEAKMRMRNIGRDTPTSAGPNSFGKTRKGFCDVKKVFERDLKSKMNEVAD